MQKIIGAGLAASLFAANPAMAQDDLLVLLPSSAWTADFGDQHCALRREFAGGGDAMFLELAQLAPDAAMRLTLASNTLALGDEDPTFAFSPVTPPTTPVIFERVTTDSGYAGVIFIVSLVSGDGASPAGQLAAAQTYAALVQSLAVDGAFARELRLETGSLGPAMEVMQTCMDDLVTSWGLDPEALRTIAQAASFDPDANWVERYFDASEDLADEYNLTSVRLQLVIDANGTASRCWAYELPENLRERNIACNTVLARARFEPALGPDLQPLDSVLHFDVARVDDSNFRPDPTAASRPETGSPR